MRTIKKKNNKTYSYPDDCGEYVQINKKIKEDFALFCKNNKINKGKLIENFYKTILIRFRDGSLNNTGYVTMHIC
jgi:hypothetical protein